MLVQTDPRTGGTLLAGCVAATLASAARIGGLTLTQWTGAAARWRWARATGATTHDALTHTGWALPGPLAGTRVVTLPTHPSPHPASHHDSDDEGEVAGAVHEPRTRRVAVTLRLDSAGGDLGEAGDRDAAAARWERWLESLGHRPELAWVSVTVETGPSPAAGLRATTTRRLAPGAPADCRALLDEVTQTVAGSAVHVETRLTLVFDLRAWDTRVGRRGRRHGAEAYLPLVERAVGHLAAGLDGCGVTVAGVMSPRRLAGAVRVAFDPAAAGTVELAHILGRDIPGWELAGPVRAREHGDRYVHDGAASVSFVWAQAPRQAVTATVLDPLMRPGRYPRRVTCHLPAHPRRPGDGRRHRPGPPAPPGPPGLDAAGHRPGRHRPGRPGRRRRRTGHPRGRRRRRLGRRDHHRHHHHPRRPTSWRRRSPRPSTPPEPPNSGCGACTACRQPDSRPGCPPGCP